MRHFLKLFDGIDPLPALLQLQDNSALWDAYTPRTADPASPHHGVSDIWLRYRPEAELTEPAHYLEPHYPVWWPAWSKLTALEPIVFGLAARCKATAIGGVFLTRIPPGGEVKPHDDAYSWHARMFGCKAYVVLSGNGRCVNTCLDEEVVMRPGEAWTFDNLVTHSVRNEGGTDRVTLIVAMRREG